MARYLVTGGAGFIGTHLVRRLLDAGHEVRVVDDFSTGLRENIAGLDLTLFEGSITDRALMRRAMDGVDVCFHQGALPSVPRSIKDPLRSNEVNVAGSLTVFLAAREAGVRRVVYASSSSVYGPANAEVLEETLPRRPISPYAVSKAAVEEYADTFCALYGQDLVGLRYFNVFGPGQREDAAYAAVVPIFIDHMRRGVAPPVFGDGQQARDFTYIDNVVAANIAAADARGRIAGAYNIACGGSVRVVDLVERLNTILGSTLAPAFKPPRPGDIPRSCASVAKARAAFGYVPAVKVDEGLRRTVAWFEGRGCGQ